MTGQQPAKRGARGEKQGRTQREHQTRSENEEERRVSTNVARARPRQVRGRTEMRMRLIMALDLREISSSSVDWKSEPETSCSTNERRTEMIMPASC